jgi:hypothetical protein
VATVKSNKSSDPFENLRNLRTYPKQ